MSEWIKCSERMPGDSGWFIVSAPRYPRGFPAEFDMGEWWDFRELRVDGVTHWMPLPDPPVPE